MVLSEERSKSNEGVQKPTAPSISSIPSISLPKGGGAIRGIGEKFAANPVTGTGSMSVPIATSLGRSGFGPQLSLSYDSGAGNGPFGFGWDLSLPSITRKTDKGLPRYWDAEESDVFVLSGAEDLVPVLVSDGSRFSETVTLEGEIYTVHRYRPRIEGLFARIERWTRQSDGDVHWRSIGKDNILTLYGKDAESRIFDPSDPSRIFSWLICETRDDKGNAILYGYKEEDGAGVCLSHVHERNRGSHDDPRRTANRYIKHIRYGNRQSLLDNQGNRPRFLSETQIQNAGWMFEVVFDYGEHHADAPTPNDPGQWAFRHDAFSNYRAGFEVRTTRLCQRVLMFHHFPAEEGVGTDCLVRSTDFTYSHEQEPANAHNPVYTFLRAVTQSGYKRSGGGYLKRSLPPVEFEYSQPIVQDRVEEVDNLDNQSLENLPFGIDGIAYQWTDLHGEGIPGILTEQANAWFYKRNLSPINEIREHGRRCSKVKFAPVELVASKPNLVLANGAQFMDLAGDGLPDLVMLDGPMPGFYEHDGHAGWQPFRPFISLLNRDMRDPNLKFVDLNGDGHADVLISEDNAFVWHASLAEAGFGPAHRVAQALDEEKGPRLVFADGTQSIYLADLSGDGLTDLVRIRNGEVCYWPNLGYGRFGAKITMDNAPHFDHPDHFEHQRIRLADIDGSGTIDIIYLHRDGVRLYFNQSGNSWSTPQILSVFPPLDNLVNIVPTDLLGNGTACLVWSSPLPGDAARPMRYVNLMGSQKPHLLVKVINDLGAETRVQYAPSTKFYLQDKRDGKPWITRLPFPVYVVERVEVFDHISRNCFVTRYAYHHGYFDGAEREFRGFGMVEQWDSEHFAETAHQSQPPKYQIGQVATAAIRDVWQFSFRPIIDIKPSINSEGGWYYFFEGINGGYHENDILLLEKAGDHALGHVWDGTSGGDLAAPLGETSLSASNIDSESHVPPVLTRTWFHTGAYLGRDHVSNFFAGLLDDKDIGEYYRERDLSDTQVRELLLEDTVLPAGLTVEEEREACRALKGAMLRQEVYALDGTDKEAHPYTVTEQNFTIRVLQERGDNRHGVFFTHAREVINYHYERNPADPRTTHAMTLEVDDFGNVLKEVAIGYGRRQPDATLPLQADRQKQSQTLITYTENRVTNAIDDNIAHPNDYRLPLPCESRTYELTGFEPENNAVRFSFDEWTRNDFALPNSATDIPYEQSADNVSEERRLIEHVRTLYREDDLTALLPLGEVERLALLAESYQLAFTPGLLDQVFQRDGLPLLPNPATVLGGQGADQGGYVASQNLKASGLFPNSDPDGHWWIPAGRVFLSPDSTHTAAQELAYAQTHFFLPHRYRDPFHAESLVSYDDYDLLMLETRDPLGNRVTVGERLPNGKLDPTKAGNNYRVLQPQLMMDPNRNRTQVAFDALGMVVGTAVMGKPEENLGDSLNGFSADLTEAVALNQLANPLTNPQPILARATTRLIYDLFAYQRTKGQSDPQPAVVYTLARETHDADLAPGEQTKIQHNFSYSDGFGREIQQKIQAEAGPVPHRDANGDFILGADGQPQMTESDVNPRWVGSGWTIFNNKGKPVRQYEPFFTDTHRFEFDIRIGVSPVLFYDPAGRVVATLHPNHSYEKVRFDPWQQTTWDVNDTVRDHPRTDSDILGYTRGYFNSQPAGWKTWHAQRQGGTLGEQAAANKAAAHANTPTIAYFDSLGRPFLTLADNGPDPAQPGQHLRFATRVELDIEGNQRAVRDAITQNSDAQGRLVMRYDYDMLGNRIHQLSMEAGARWMLNDVAGNPIRAWDSRGHTFRTEYDPLRRPLRSFVTGANPANPNQEQLTERLLYGEQHPEVEARNLRGQLYLHLDEAGALTTESLDFKGNPLRASRRIATEYKQTIDWSTVDAALPTNATASFVPAILEAALAPLLEAETYTSQTTYDALNRPVTLRSPDNSVIRPGYNEANLLERVDANLRGATDQHDLPVWTPFVTNINYDAKGQRKRIDYRNGTSTFYGYDPLTFRLVHLLTQCNAVAFPDDCPQPPPAGWPGCQVQNLHYTYDPVGNITHIRDDAQQTIYFRNQRVEPSADYTYDAIYRLIEATSREHLGQIGGTPIPHSHNDVQRIGWLHPGDGNAMGTYIERYLYDAVGNILQMQHRGSDSAHPDWTRTYTYQEASLIEPAKQSNRLSHTTVGNNNPITEQYTYDAHGNMMRMNHLPLMRWDYRDQLQATSQQVVNNGGTPEITYYIYDASGQRVRKVTERQAAVGQTPTRMKERIYLGGFEIYREYASDGNTPTIERETLHIMDDQQRIALVETRTQGNDPAPEQLIRYQLGNHLGSASLELDDQAQIISYEEYTPYGSTSYQAVRSQTETPKRYRYTDKERDEETGFSYHGFRYYAPWLGRWTSCDPIGIDDHINLYVYTRNNPVNATDPFGLWSWRKVAAVGAAVTVGVVVTVATAGAAAPVAAAAVASIGLTGTAATVATGLAVGAVAGAVGGAAAGAAGETTRQAVHGEQLSRGRILREAGTGAAIGGAVGAAIPLAAAAIPAAGSAVAGMTAGAAVIGAARTVGGRVATSAVGRAVATGARATSQAARTVARQPGVRQGVQGTRSVAQATSRGLQKVERASENLGVRAGQRLFPQGSQGVQVVERFRQTHTIPGSFGTIEPRVYRVQGGTPPAASRPRINIGANGEMDIQGQSMLHVTFEDAGHTRYFLSKRPGANVMSFDVQPGFLNQVRRAAVRQADARTFPGRPQIDDPTKTASAFGLPAPWQRSLEQAAVPGTGRVGGLGLINNQATIVTGATTGVTRY